MSPFPPKWHKPWSLAQDVFLCQTLRAGQTYKEVARTLGRTPVAIRHRARLHGLSRRVLYPSGGWTTPQLQRLREARVNGETMEALGKELGKHPSTCSKMALKKGYPTRTPWKEYNLQ